MRDVRSYRWYSDQRAASRYRMRKAVAEKNRIDSANCRALADQFAEAFPFLLHGWSDCAIEELPWHFAGVWDNVVGASRFIISVDVTSSVFIRIYAPAWFQESVIEAFSALGVQVKRNIATVEFTNVPLAGASKLATLLQTAIACAA